MPKSPLQAVVDSAPPPLPLGKGPAPDIVPGAPMAERAPAEFGGTLGVVLIMLFSHVVPYYLWICWRFHDGAATYPQGWYDVSRWLGQMAAHLGEAAPTWEATTLFLGFLGVQALFAVALPGPSVKGLPLPPSGNRRLLYRCNGIWAWYLTLIIVGVIHFSGLYPLERIPTQFGALLTVASLFANAVALILCGAAHLSGTTFRMSGKPICDFFMGCSLNPRIGRLDLKMWAEIRISWMLLFLLTASAAARQFAEYGTLSTPMLFMLLAHGLYTNACMKGEECIPTTWDIFYEKWGWMLIFWNFAGVPFVYCFNSMYLASRQPGVEVHSLPYTVMCFALLLSAYYVWDTAQSQRNRFRMQLNGSYVPRWTFPQLPWGTLENPSYLETASGKCLLVDGWWKYARKIHYTADIAMALSWGLICGFDHFLPYFYFMFFVMMILHRAKRDHDRCRQKYGDDWQRYMEKVPWVFIPGVF